MTKYPFYTALTQLKDFYGIDLDEDTFETYAMSAYNKIGNKDYKMYHFKAIPEPDCDGGWYVEKPCNLSSIEAITLNFEAASENSSIENYPGLRNHSVEQWIEADKRMPNELYIPGKFVKYKELGNRIYFTEPYPEVNILYKGQYFDEDGLPYINDREMDAIVAYCAYAYDYKKGRLTKDANTIQIAAVEKQDWQRLCSAARAPQELSQNAMNEILDVMTSWNVHSHGVSSSKPVL